MKKDQSIPAYFLVLTTNPATCCAECLFCHEELRPVYKKNNMHQSHLPSDEIKGWQVEKNCFFGSEFTVNSCPCRKASVSELEKIDAMFPLENNITNTEDAVKEEKTNVEN